MEKWGFEVDVKILYSDEKCRKYYIFQGLQVSGWEPSPYFVLQQINVVNFDHHKMKIAQKVLYLLSQFKMTWVSVATGWVCLVFDAW